MNWLRAGARWLLRLWFRTGRKVGWHYQIVETFGARLATASPLSTRLPNRTVVACDLREQIPRLIYFQGVYEPPEAYLFERLLRPGWTVIDCGANLGQYTLLAAPVVGAAGSVHCFEPVPATAALLRRNVAANQLSAVFISEAALWHQPATLQLGLSAENAFTSGGFSVGVRPESGLLAREISAPAVVFDDYAAAHGLASVHLVKMDIEGAEYFALQGMRQTLRRHHPFILIEVCRPYAERLGYSLSNIWNLLVSELGYQALAIGLSAADCYPLTGLDDMEQQNVLFHHRPLPPDLVVGWDQRSLLRWSRQGWRRS